MTISPRDEPSFRRPRRVVALTPIPVWVSVLADTTVSAAAAWATDLGVFVRVTTNAGALSFEYAGERGWFCLLGKRRLLIARTAGSEDVECFVRRLRWLCGVENDYVPSAAETEVHRLCEELARAEDPNAALSVAERGDPAPPDVAAYLALLRPGWAAGASDAELPAWLMPVAHLVNGDFDGLRELAKRSVEAGPLANVVGVAFELAGFHHAACAAFERGIESVFGAQRADASLELAKLWRALGDSAAAVRWARAALTSGEPDDALIVRAALELVQNGAFDDARIVLQERAAQPPLERDVVLALVELMLWAGWREEARGWLDHAGGEDVRVLRARGILRALDGDFTEAVQLLTRAHELTPRSSDVASWLAELHLRLSEREAAAHFLARSRVKSQSAVHIALSTAIHGTGRKELVSLLERLGEPLNEQASAEEVRRAALDLLTRFGGNRGELLTLARPEVSGLGLELAPRPDAFSPRDAAADTIKLVGIEPIADIERRLQEIADEHPSSAHPFCYWGELELWLGNYARATELFERALTRHRARWAYVGKAAALVMCGDYAAAEAQIAECERWFVPVLGATTPVYMGEASRRRGDLARARELSKSAVDAKPTRAGAWLNLALAEHGLGSAHEAQRIFDMLQARLPRLFADVSIALGGERRWPIPSSELQPALERALEMMRGNRSSHTITYFDASGALRIAQSVERWREPLAKQAAFVAMDLRRRLAIGAVREQD